MTKKILFLALFLFHPALQAIREPTPEEYAFVKTIVSPGDLVFDIGSNVGFKAKQYLAAGAHVIAVDAVWDCCEYVRHVFRNNPNITLVHAGVGDKHGILEISTSENGVAFSTFSEEWKENSRWRKSVKWDLREPVAMITLDDLIAKYGVPRYCKIDVENYEPEVLQGLSQPIPYISFECHFEMAHKLEQCVRRLEEIGYKEFNIMVGENTDFAFNMWVDGDTFLRLFQVLATPDYAGPALWGDAFARCIENT